MPATAVYQIAMPPADAYDHTREALQAAGAVLVTEARPNRIDFAIHRKDPDTGALDLTTTGSAVLSAAADGKTTVMLSLEAATTLFAYGLGLGLAALIVGAWLFGGGPLWFLIVLAAEAWLFWSVFNKWPTVILDAVREKMAASPSVSGGAAVVQPVVAPIFTPPPPGGPPSTNTAEIAEQIRQLAGLRDQGHITAEEFEAKKAELLKRI